MAALLRVKAQPFICMYAQRLATQWEGTQLNSVVTASSSSRFYVTMFYSYIGAAYIIYNLSL